MNTLKKCSRCGNTKPGSEFYVHKQKGLSSWCKECYKEDRDINKEKVEMVDDVSQYQLPNYKTVDHIVPLSKGGLHTKDNIVFCCSHCNCKKKNKLGEEG